MKSLVAFFEIPAIDFDQAVRFYEAVFNVQLSVMDCKHEKMAYFPEENGECLGAISRSSAINFLPSENGVLVSLRVSNMETAIATIEENGGKIIIPKTKIEAESRGYFANFIDSEENRVGLYSEE